MVKSHDRLFTRGFMETFGGILRGMILGLGTAIAFWAIYLLGMAVM